MDAEFKIELPKRLQYQQAWRARRMFERMVNSLPEYYDTGLKVFFPQGDIFHTSTAYWGREIYGDAGHYDWLNAEARALYENKCWWQNELTEQAWAVRYQLQDIEDRHWSWGDDG